MQLNSVFNVSITFYLFIVFDVVVVTQVILNNNIIIIMPIATSVVYSRTSSN